MSHFHFNQAEIMALSDPLAVRADMQSTARIFPSGQVPRRFGTSR